MASTVRAVMICVRHLYLSISIYMFFYLWKNKKNKAFLHSSIACKTTDAKIYNTLEGDDYPVPEQNKVCLFPFASGRTDYFNCTDVDMEGTGHFWCVTNYTTFNDVDYENGWGLCNDACPKQPGIASRPVSYTHLRAHET